MLKSANSEKELELLEKLQGSVDYNDKCMRTALECLIVDETLGHSKHTVGETVGILMSTYDCSRDYAISVVMGIVGDNRMVKE